MTHPNRKREWKLAGMDIKRHYVIIAVVALLMVLFILINALTAKRQREQLAAGHDSLTTSVHNELNTAISQLAQTGDFGFSDYRTAIATIRRHLYAADALSSALVLYHGDQSALFDKELYNQLESALDACDRALELGQSMDEPMALLRASMDKLAEAMQAMFGPDALIAIPSA